MSKRVEQDGKFYRKRRGKLVEIPSEWVGFTTHPQTIRKRPSKQIHKLRKVVTYGSDRATRHGGGRHRREQESERVFSKEELE